MAVGTGGKRRSLWSAVLPLMLLIATACSSSNSPTASDLSEDATTTTSAFEDSDPSDATAASITTAPKTIASSAETTTTATTTLRPARTIEELRDRWADNRQLIVDELRAEIAAGNYGVGDDNILRGPGRFEIDLSQCPDEWSDTTGVSDTEIRMAHTASFSSLGSYQIRVLGIGDYFHHINESGGIAGRMLRFETRDDAYFPEQTISITKQLVDEDFLWVSNLGTPTALSVRGLLNEECVPQPFVVSAHPVWGDAQHFPWSVGLELSYATEAALWGEWIRSARGDELPVKVGAIVMDNSFGWAYEDAFTRFAEANPEVVGEFMPVRHDPAGADVADEVAEVAAAKPDVFVSMTAGNACVLTIQAVAGSGLLDTLDAAFTPSVCRRPDQYLDPAGDDGDGWLSVHGGRRDLTDPRWANDPYAAWVTAELAERGDYGWDYEERSIGFGLYGFAHVEALRIAAELPGGVSRTNLMLAIRSLRLDHPLLPTGVGFGLAGNDDGYPIEGSEIVRYDAERHRWEATGAIIDVGGSTPPCHDPDLEPTAYGNGVEARCEP